MILKGRAFKFGDNISTDIIIAGKYKFSTLDMKELAEHVMEDADPDFHQKIKPGQSFIVAGQNWGMGSSREQAPLALKAAGINAILAKSFARIFFRNAINIGLIVVECDTDQIEPDDELMVDLEAGLIENVTRGRTIAIKPLPQIMLKILNDGGLVEHFKKYRGFEL